MVLKAYGPSVTERGVGTEQNAKYAVRWSSSSSSRWGGEAVPARLSVEVRRVKKRRISGCVLSCLYWYSVLPTDLALAWGVSREISQALSTPIQALPLQPTFPHFLPTSVVDPVVKTCTEYYVVVISNSSTSPAGNHFLGSFRGPLRNRGGGGGQQNVMCGLPLSVHFF
jgi:hypothetical protein